MSVYAVLTVLAVIVLVGSEVMATSWAFIWAVSGLMDIPREAAMALQAIAMTAAIAATAKMGQLAWRAERGLMNTPAMAV
jgi:hypothetical protein